MKIFYFKYFQQIWIFHSEQNSDQVAVILHESEILKILFLEFFKYIVKAPIYIDLNIVRQQIDIIHFFKTPHLFLFISYSGKHTYTSE